MGGSQRWALPGEQWGALAHNRQLTMSHGIGADMIPEEDTALSSGGSPPVQAAYSYLQNRQLHITPSKPPTSQAGVNRGCSALLFWLRYLSVAFSAEV